MALAPTAPTTESGATRRLTQGPWLRRHGWHLAERPTELLPRQRAPAATGVCRRRGRRDGQRHRRSGRIGAPGSTVNFRTRHGPSPRPARHPAALRARSSTTSSPGVRRAPRPRCASARLLHVQGAGSTVGVGTTDDPAGARASRGGHAEQCPADGRGLHVLRWLHPRVHQRRGRYLADPGLVASVRASRCGCTGPAQAPSCSSTSSTTATPGPPVTTRSGGSVAFVDDFTGWHPARVPVLGLQAQGDRERRAQRRAGPGRDARLRAGRPRYRWAEDLLRGQRGRLRGRRAAGRWRSTSPGRSPSSRRARPER